MRIAFCWPTMSGYMAACWTELARRSGVELFVVSLRRARGKHSAFRPEVMDGVPSLLLEGEERYDYRRIRSALVEHSPDVLFLSGWQHRTYIPLAYDPALRGARRFMIIDTPLRGTLRQRIGRLPLQAYVRRMEGVFVPGERSWQYARHLGFPEHRVHRGTYGVDWTGLSPLWCERADADGGWPRAFLFTGQYIRRKGVDVLARAYTAYRGRLDDPWPLHCCGRGPAAEALRGVTGIEDHGFLQPDELKRLRARSAAFVLPSRADAWPLALVENCAAGLPVLCTEACGSAVELVRPYHNGLAVATGDADALADGLVWLHENHDRLPAMGRASRDLAAPYSAERWADRILAACRS